MKESSQPEKVAGPTGKRFPSRTVSSGLTRPARSDRKQQHEAINYKWL